MHRSRCLPLVVAFAARLVAQDATVSNHQAVALTTGDPRIPVHTRADEPGHPAYGTWAAGAQYKASFHDGMTFVPCLGRDYPQTQSLAWRTTSVRVGGRELIAAGTQPSMTHGDYRVEYRRGGVVEAYDVLPNGLEQTFTIAERPAAAGALQITGALTTSLWTPAVEAGVGELVFRDAAGVPIVSYGQAVAIDADGDRFPMTTTCVGNVVTLQLSAASVAAADFPLVVDPLLTANSAVAVGAVTDVGETDCASESTNTSINSVFCYTRHYSATDADVIARIGTLNLTTSYQAFVDLSGATSAEHPRVAYVSATNSWVVVYQSLNLANQGMEIRAAKFAGGTAPVSLATAYALTHATNIHDWRPAVGGVADGGAGTYALVVFQRETGVAAFANTATSTVMGALFNTATTTGTWTGAFPIQGSASEDTERPSINRAAEGGSAFSWFVVCQAFTNNAGNDDWDLFGRLVTNTGAVSANAWISSLGTTHKLGPVVDGRNGRFCVAFSTANTSTGKVQDVVGNDIRCARLDWAHGDASPSAAGNYPAETLQTNTFRILEATGIAHNGASRSHWAIAYRSSSTSPAIYATRVGYQGKPLQSPDLIATTGFTTPGAPSVLHNDQNGTTTVCYMLAGATAEVWSRVWDLPAPLNPQFATTSCSNNTGIGWTGPTNVWTENQRIGSQFAGPYVIGAPANSLHLLFVTTATANVPIVHPIVANGCTLLVPISGPDFLGNLPLAIGAEATWQLPLPESLPGLTLHFQDWFLDPATDLFRGTSRMSVQLVK